MYNLVDTMSFFGVKGPLKHAILTGDKWFSSPEEMVSYIQGLQTDKDMHFSLVDKSQLLQKRENRESMIIESLMGQHMIAFHCEVTVKTKVNLC